MFTFLQRLILFLVAFTVPIQATQWSIGGLSFSATKLAVVLLLMLVGVQLLSPAHRRLPPDRSLLLLAVFAASVVISGFVAVAHGQPIGLSVRGSLRFAGLLVFYIALLLAVRSRTELLILLWGLTLGGALAAAPAIQAAATGTLFDPRNRFQGLGGQPNTLAYELSIAVAIAVGLFFSTRSFFAKLVLVGAGVLMLLAIGGSLSRSAFGGLFVMWVVWLVRSGRFDTLKYAIPALVVAALLLAFLPTEVHERMATVVDSGQRKYDTGVIGRTNQAIWALKAFLSNPVTGVGVNNFLSWVKAQPGGYMWDYTMHNSFLYMLATQGLLGFVPFVAFHWLAWRDYSAVIRIATARRKRGDPWLRELSTLALFLQIALVGSVVGAMAHQETTSKGLWIVFALSAAVLNLARKRGEELDASVAPEADELSYLGYRPPPRAAAQAG